MISTLFDNRLTASAWREDGRIRRSLADVKRNTSIAIIRKRPIQLCHSHPKVDRVRRKASFHQNDLDHIHIPNVAKQIVRRQVELKVGTSITYLGRNARRFGSPFVIVERVKAFNAVFGWVFLIGTVIRMRVASRN
jgi:hypothetical protein